MFATVLAVHRLRRQDRPARRRGFTLIEVMVVVVILSILAAVVVPRIMDNPDKARVVKAKQDIRVIKNQLDFVPAAQFPLPDHRTGIGSAGAEAGRSRALARGRLSGQAAQ